jgi:hypothetical protein
MHFLSDTRVLELGSGAGFLKEFIPQLITSELFSVPGVERIIDAQAIAMGDTSFDGIVMTDVLHHIPNCCSFFHEASHVIRVGGKVVMIEPWNTTWSRWVYQRLHYEPFEPDARGNGGFRRQILSLVRMVPFPGLFFSAIGSHSNRGIRSGTLSAFIQIMPIAYLLSGGVSMRSLVPGWMYQPVRRLVQYGNESLRAMFAMIILKRQRVNGLGFRAGR